MKDSTDKPARHAAAELRCDGRASRAVNRFPPPELCTDAEIFFLPRPQNLKPQYDPDMNGVRSFRWSMLTQKFLTSRTTWPTEREALVCRSRNASGWVGQSERAEAHNSFLAIFWPLYFFFLESLKDHD